MEKTKEQKILNVLAIIEILAGIINILISIFMMAGGGFALDHVNQLVQETTATAEQATMVGNLFLYHGIAMCLRGVLQIIIGIMMRKLSSDATKYKLVRILVIISLVLSVAGLISCIFTKDYETLLTNVFSIAIDGYILYLIEKIRKDA